MKTLYWLLNINKILMCYMLLEIYHTHPKWILDFKKFVKKIQGALHIERLWRSPNCHSLATTLETCRNELLMKSNSNGEKLESDERKRLSIGGRRVGVGRQRAFVPFVGIVTPAGGANPQRPPLPRRDAYRYPTTFIISQKITV